MVGERSVQLARNARAGIIRNVITGIVSLATVPLALKALGTEGYGTFQVLLSIGNLAAMSDVGLGLALFTRVGQLAGARQHDRIRHTVGGALMVISLVVAVVASISIGALALVDIPRFLKTPHLLHDQVQIGLYLILAAFVVRMPLSVFSSAHGGLQLSDRTIGWTAGGAVSASIGMLAAALLTKRVDVAIGVHLFLSLAGTAGAIRLGCRLEPSSKPAFRWEDIALGWELLRSGFFYYVLQLEGTIIGGLDNLVIAKVLGVGTVTLYSVAWRVISLLHSIVYSLGGSFWAGVSQAIGHGDIVWIRSEAARLRRLGTLWMAVFSGGFVAVGVPVIALWTGNRLQVSPLLLVVLGIYFALLGHTMIDMAILNGANKTRQQIVTVGLDATLNLGLSVFLAHRLGYVGVGLGTLVAYSLCSFGPLQYFSWRLVAEGSRPPFWTRSLSAMVLSVGGGFGIHLGLSRIVGLGRIGVTLLGGSASLLVTMALIRGITGAEGIDAFRASFRRTARPAVASSPQPI